MGTLLCARPARAQATAADESTDAQAKADLDALVALAMKEFDVPGLCVAIVKDDRVVVSQGYGVCEKGGDEQVNDETLFAIASNTKAFTAVALGILVDQGKLNWGDPVVDHLPGFRMSDRFVTLIPSANFERERAANPGVEISPQRGTPFAMRRELLLSPLGLPCNPPPWGTLAAVDIAKGEILWQVPLGTIRDVAPIPIPLELGVPNLGGPLATQSGLIFIAAAMDNYLRAYDVATGEELWKGRLPAGGQATPMTYRATRGGRQFVVIAAGGHARAGTKLGDSLVAYALPDPGH